MLWRRLSAPLLALAALAATHAAAAENPLDAIPKSASVLIRLNGLDPVSNKLAEFVGQVDEGAGRQVKQLSSFVGVLISNPTLAGADEEGEWWVAVFARGEDEPAVVFAIPATDADAMKEAIGEDFTFHTHGDYVLYSEDPDAIADIEKHVKAKGESIAEVIDDASMTTLTQADISLFVNAPALRETYKEQLEQAEGQIEQFLEAAGEQAPETPGVNMQAVFEMYAEILRGVSQVVRDTDGLTVGLSVAEDAVSVVEFVSLRPDTPTDAFLEKQEPSDLALLKQLPAEQLAYLAVHADMKSVMQWSARISAAMYEGDEKTKQAFADMMEGFGELDYGSYAMAFGLGDTETGLLRAYVLQEVRPVDKLRQLMQKSFATMSEIKLNGVTTEVDYEPNAETYGNRKADVVRVTQEYTPEADPNGMLQTFMEILYGEDGMVQRLVFLNGKLAQTMGGGQESMQSLLQAVDAGTGPRQALAARGKLAEKANLVGLVDLPHVMTEALRAVIESGQVPLPLDADALGELEIAPSYVGFSVTCEPHAVRCRTHVPIEQVKGIAEIVQEVQRQINQQAF